MQVTEGVLTGETSKGVRAAGEQGQDLGKDEISGEPQPQLDPTGSCGALTARPGAVGH